ncbi:beta 1-4 rhamnosyltransferase Cps2T [Pediococcus acidilactici]|uniref:beta 1-4 rhamnosyltransferase Cps2T n=1 Tax=Pediococcus acidilactici TaxID=1254 RepID=UPI0023302F8D|nr:glycosyltransferase family 1 protein [Pediococcus acidilactici]MDB8859132.1 glycosyltransferase family 1 protein [Pediococcus acidilactici]MDB8860556.1 glycosyltransferase family 1 protein [Pediococcus acidilactici]MDB8862834.1 glycosyltransferase family 1 protein [Pediococcus acidilactici]MDB8866432.1 glycosyltransferase family 1 protein [Pediococcus acidilactici]
METQNVFIVGAKGIPAKYGGYESFVEQLTKRKISDNIRYFVACRRDLSDNKSDTFMYNNATCFNVGVPNVGPARAILYDLKALNWSIKYIKEHNVSNPIVYVLACRIGPFISKYKKQLKQLGGKLYVNPDGHEWLRAKWSKPVREYWKISEKLMVKHADLLVCDSKNIEKYIKKEYKKYMPNTTFIAYGADIKKSNLAIDSPEMEHWYKKFEIKPQNYYLIVGRFVPENNYETMIKEFMDSNTQKDLVIITNVEKNKFFDELKEKTHFNEDARIKFVGTVYDQELLKKIRENAFAYLHGHSVGGTNPSLLEALASTRMNLLFDIGFNREVAEDSALYWTKNKGNLANLIGKVDNMDKKVIDEFSERSSRRVNEEYSWFRIVGKYEKLFIGPEGNEK